MENIVFVSSHLSGLDFHGQEELRSKLRLDLINMGLNFFPATINGQKYFMVPTKHLAAMKLLAKKYNQSNIYISDNRRTTFVVSLADNSPTKLGTLKRSLSQPAPGAQNTGSGPFCLIVSDNNKEYYYSVE